MQYQPLELREFHGGITDNFIDGLPHQYQAADNFLVTVNKKLYSRPGSHIFNEDDPQIPVGAQAVTAMIDHYASLLSISAKKLYYLDGANLFQTLQGPSSNDVFTQGDINSRVTWSDWNKHTFLTNDDFAPVMKIYQDASNDLQVRSAGLPEMASPTLAGGGVGSNNYIYAFVYFYEYNVGTVVHNDFGPVTQVQIENITTPDASTVNITNIPVLSNGADYNYDTSNIKVKIYRTQANGTSLTYLGEVTNGTTSYNDTASDASILNNASIYTSGGQLENDPPPLCKCLHVTDTLGLYGHIKTSSGEILSNRVRQSIPSDPDSCPESLYIDLDDEIIAISSVGQTPVVLCRESIYRLDGFFTGTGEGLLEAQEIESTVGCVSATSVVQVQRGIVFAGKTGFYFTDGWEVRKLSNSFNDTYKLLVGTEQQRERIYGTFDKDDKRVWWSVQENDSLYQNKCFILDTRYGLGIANEELEHFQACFTTASNGEYFRPTSLLFFNGKLLRGDTRGYIFEHDSEDTSDPLIDTTKAVAAWDRVYLPWDYKTVAFSFGSTLQRKFVPRMVFSAENKTNVTIQLNSINDIGKQTKSVKPVRFRKNWRWGDPIKEWGEETEIWDFQGVIEEERRFHSQSLRCSYKQVQVTNAYDVIMNSDDMITATVNAALKTVTLDNIVDYEWPTYPIGQFIAFENDNYANEFEVIGRTGDTLTLRDSTGLLPTGSYKWTLRGYSKDEELNLISLALWYAYLGGPADYAAASAGSTP